MMITPLPAAGEHDTSVFWRLVGWLTVLSMMAWPRLFLLGFWIFGDLVGKAIHSSAVCVLGFLLLPTTTFAYAVMWGAGSDQVYGAEWIVVGIAFLVDIGVWLGLAQLIRR
jgi:hypothetical protein